MYSDLNRISPAVAANEDYPITNGRFLREIQIPQSFKALQMHQDSLNGKENKKIKSQKVTGPSSHQFGLSLQLKVKNKLTTSDR